MGKPQQILFTVTTIACDIDAAHTIQETLSVLIDTLFLAATTEADRQIVQQFVGEYTFTFPSLTPLPSSSSLSSTSPVASMSSYNTNSQSSFFSRLRGDQKKRRPLGEDRITRGAACECLKELELCFPGLLCHKLGWIYWMCQQETTHAMQSFYTLFAVVFQHTARHLLFVCQKIGIGSLTTTNLENLPSTSPTISESLTSILADKATIVTSDSSELLSQTKIMIPMPFSAPSAPLNPLAVVSSSPQTSIAHDISHKEFFEYFDIYGSILEHKFVPLFNFSFSDSLISTESFTRNQYVSPQSPDFFLGISPDLSKTPLFQSHFETVRHSCRSLVALCPSLVADRSNETPPNN